MFRKKLFLYLFTLLSVMTTTAPAIVISGSGTLTQSAFRADPGVGISRIGGFNHDGVAETIFKGSRGTASLLWTGRHILTAGHVVTGDGPNPSILSGNGNVNFQTAGGNFSYSFNSSNIRVHSDWEGDNRIRFGWDVAVINLGVDVDLSIPRYDIYRGAGSFEIIADHPIHGGSPVNDLTVTMIGYGRTGTGSTGNTGSSGTKHWGQNTYGERDSLRGLLYMDFDNGMAAQDGSIRYEGLGLGEYEATPSSGDSGGPQFIEDPDNAGEYLIAGITSFSSSSSEDIDGSINDTFGEYDGATNVAAVHSWIDSAVAIPEPSTFTLLLLGAGTLFCRRKFRG